MNIFTGTRTITWTTENEWTGEVTTHTVKETRADRKALAAYRAARAAAPASTDEEW